MGQDADIKRPRAPDSATAESAASDSSQESGNVESDAESGSVKSIRGEATPQRSHFEFQMASAHHRPSDVQKFKSLQRELVTRWISLRDEPNTRRDVVVVPSLSLDGFQLSEVQAVNHYEERMLFMLAHLRNPRTHLVYVTSQPLLPSVVDYHLGLLGGIPTAHARARLTLAPCCDGTPRPLSEKLLERPRLLERIRGAVNTPQSHLTVFTVSDAERDLANALEMPLYGVDPDLLPFGTKSGSREVFREAGISMSPGFENLHSEKEVAEALAELWEANPTLRRAVIKLNEGFSGEGNAVFEYQTASEVAPGRASHAARVDGLREALAALAFSGPKETWPHFRASMERLGGVVEEFIEGVEKRSPCAQLRIDPTGALEAISTHDQVLGGPKGQTYLGCRFPADPEYRLDIQSDSIKVGEVLVSKGVVGRVAVDFVVVERSPGVWERYALEINMRMSGTTHPLMNMQLLTHGTYDVRTGLHMTPRGEPRYYVATDNLSAPHYRGLMPGDVLDIAVMHGLHYRPWTETGVIFHLLGAVSEFGKCGMTAVGSSPEEAQDWYDRTRVALDVETIGREVDRSSVEVPPSRRI
jgi:hypothetical protein